MKLSDRIRRANEMHESPDKELRDEWYGLALELEELAEANGAGEGLSNDDLRGYAERAQAIAAEEQQARLAAEQTCRERCIESARIAYTGGHNDTVEGTLGDSLEVSTDLVNDLAEEEGWWPFHVAPLSQPPSAAIECSACDFSGCSAGCKHFQGLVEQQPPAAIAGVVGQLESLADWLEQFELEMPELEVRRSIEQLRAAMEQGGDPVTMTIGAETGTVSRDEQGGLIVTTAPEPADRELLPLQARRDSVPRCSECSECSGGTPRGCTHAQFDLLFDAVGELQSLPRRTDAVSEVERALRRAGGRKNDVVGMPSETLLGWADRLAGSVTSSTCKHRDECGNGRLYEQVREALGCTANDSTLQMIRVLQDGATTDVQPDAVVHIETQQELGKLERRLSEASRKLANAQRWFEENNPEYLDSPEWLDPEFSFSEPDETEPYPDAGEIIEQMDAWESTIVGNSGTLTKSELRYWKNSIRRLQPEPVTPPSVTVVRNPGSPPYVFAKRTDADAYIAETRARGQKERRILGHCIVRGVVEPQPEPEHVWVVAACSADDVAVFAQAKDAAAEQHTRRHEVHCKALLPVQGAAQPEPARNKPTLLLADEWPSEVCDGCPVWCKTCEDWTRGLDGGGQCPVCVADGLEPEPAQSVAGVVEEDCFDSDEPCSYPDYCDYHWMAAAETHREEDDLFIEEIRDLERKNLPGFTKTEAQLVGIVFRLKARLSRATQVPGMVWVVMSQVKPRVYVENPTPETGTAVCVEVRGAEQGECERCKDLEERYLKACQRHNQARRERNKYQSLLRQAGALCGNEDPDTMHHAVRRVVTERDALQKELEQAEAEVVRWAREAINLGYHAGKPFADSTPLAPHPAPRKAGPQAKEAPPPPYVYITIPRGSKAIPTVYGAPSLVDTDRYYQWARVPVLDMPA